MKITSEITRYGELKVYVTADKGTHHSTIASAVWKHVKALPQPEYRSTVTGSRPGKWCLPQYSGEWKQVGGKTEPGQHIRKYFTSWPVPDYSN